MAKDAGRKEVGEVGDISIKIKLTAFYLYLILLHFKFKLMFMFVNFQLMVWKT